MRNGKYHPFSNSLHFHHMLSFLAILGASTKANMNLTKIEFDKHIYLLPGHRMPMLIHAIHEWKRGSASLYTNSTSSHLSTLIDFIEAFAKHYKIGKQTETETNGNELTISAQITKDIKELSVGFGNEKIQSALTVGNQGFSLGVKLTLAQSAEGDEQSIYLDEIELEDGRSLLLMSRHEDTFDDLKKDIYTQPSLE